MKKILILSIIFYGVAPYFYQPLAKQSKGERFINSHNSCGGGGLNNSYKMWKDGLIYYTKTTKSINYSVKELTDGESLNLFIFVENDKLNKILTVKSRNKNDSRSLQGFISEVIRE